MNFFCELLQSIKQRPGMFLRKKSISYLHEFLAGYDVARCQMGLSPAQQQEFNGFQEWIQIKFNNNSTRSWADIILLNSEDESQAFDRFFELLEEFKKMRPQ